MKVRMKVSIIIPVLDSHEILRRQFLHFENMGIPKDTEIIIVDDGSEMPIGYEGTLPVTILRTNDKRPWTWALARNMGAKQAKGDMLLMFDLDHIITRELLDMVRTYDGEKIQFEREFAVLTEDGTFTQDLGILMSYGFPETRLKNRGLKVSPLPNNFAMKKTTFWDMGGYREDVVERDYPQGEDRMFKSAWNKRIKSGISRVHTERPTIYMFPNGYYCGDVDHNPFNLFHTLSRKTNRNDKYTRGR